jgi:hypothetical protein
MRRFLLSLTLVSAAVMAFAADARAQSGSVGVSLMVTDVDAAAAVIRNLTFGTLPTPTTQVAVAPSVGAGAQSGLWEVTGHRRSSRMNARVTLPTRLASQANPTSILPVRWDDAAGDLLSCNSTAEGSFACVADTQRRWVIPAAPVGVTSYTFDFAPCATYTSPTAFTCNLANNVRWGNTAPPVYVSIGGRVVPTGGERSGTFEGTVTLTVLSFD